jgi:putative transport protein
MKPLLDFLNHQPFILLFLMMAGGYALANVTVKGISLGATAATLLLSLALSLWASSAYGVAFALPEFASVLFFNLFMFSVGMKVGPQFLVGLQLGARNFIVIAVLVPALATGLMLLLRLAFDVPPGMTAGIFAGANTATPGLGAAQAAFASGAADVPSGLNKTQISGNLSTAFAFSYSVSTVLFIILLKILPRLFGRDPVADARAFERSIAGADDAPLPGTAEEFLPAALPVQRRVYRVEQPALVGRRLAELRRQHPLLAVEGLLRGGQSLPLAGDLVLQAGDEIAVYGRLSSLLLAEPRIGPELDEPRIGDVVLQTVDVVQRNDAVIGKKLRELAGDIGHGLYLNAMFRAGDPIPHVPEVELQKGDVLRVTGSPERIARLEKDIGRVVKASTSTDVLTLALGLCAGAALGALTLSLGSIRLSLGLMPT